MRPEILTIAMTIARLITKSDLNPLEARMALKKAEEYVGDPKRIKAEARLNARAKLHS